MSKITRLPDTSINTSLTRDEAAAVLTCLLYCRHKMTSNTNPEFRGLVHGLICDYEAAGVRRVDG